ncbi:helix-turn-helix transcriptional regulator [Fulvivirga sp. 29W222]|uniref:Helix-turn-helix transcriptional regulator n=1 Tax=Fulvivirga marina TaxID=2494733 RepID=A0A937KD52_9BACT|nr:helix-turn-helix domain-containing protein [Fulvivirga marina]MBL6445878.1 helix-turn-helix transcriptional regulator [Fulvivirga marina]
MASYNRKTPPKNDCPMEAAVNAISGKWKLAILCELNRGTCRLKDLEAYNPEASKRALTQQLGELVDDGIITKKDFDVYPKKVEYSLTPLGKEFMVVINALGKIGEKM